MEGPDVAANQFCQPPTESMLGCCDWNVGKVCTPFGHQKEKSGALITQLLDKATQKYW